MYPPAHRRRSRRPHRNRTRPHRRHARWSPPSRACPRRYPRTSSIPYGAEAAPSVRGTEAHAHLIFPKNFLRTTKATGHRKRVVKAGEERDRCYGINQHVIEVRQPVIGIRGGKNKSKNKNNLRCGG